MMRAILSAFGILAALVLLGVSGVMNFYFLWGLGKSPGEALALGAASAAADGLKALLPFFIAWAWRSKRPAVAVPGMLVWAFFSCFSLLSAIGFAAGNRGAVIEQRQATSVKLQTQQADLQSVRAALADLPEHRPAGVLEAELKAHQQSERWALTGGCTDATVPASLEYCQGYFALEAEQAAAVEDVRLSAEIERLTGEIEALRSHGAGQDSDPQISLLAKLLGHDAVGGIRLALIVLVALLVEIGSSLGLYLSTRHGRLGLRALKARLTAPQKPKRRPKPQRPVGRVEDFLLERAEDMHDVPEPSQALYAEYCAWCRGKQSNWESHQVFSEVISKIGE